jgi:putative transposase
MALWQLYYHFVWATKEREPLIVSDKETAIHNYIVGKADSLKCIIHAINGMSDHIHLIASIPPTIAVAEFVKNIKGSSSHYVNHVLASGSQNFGWQAGYGVFSLGRKQLEYAVTYVQNQKAHHAAGTVFQALEQESESDDIPKRWHSGLSNPSLTSLHPPGNQFPGS